MTDIPPNGAVDCQITYTKLNAQKQITSTPLPNIHIDCGKKDPAQVAAKLQKLVLKFAKGYVQKAPKGQKLKNALKDVAEGAADIALGGKFGN